MKAVLDTVKSNTQPRVKPVEILGPLSNAYGMEFDSELVSFLSCVEQRDVESYEDPNAWQFFDPEAYVIPHSDRPFDDALEQSRKLTGGFGLLQTVMPMVPVIKLERRDNVFAILSDPLNFVVYPQESLFDVEASELYWAGNTLSDLDEGVSKNDLELTYDWNHKIVDAFNRCVSFVYVCVQDEEFFDPDTFHDVLDFADHTSFSPPTDYSINDAFYFLARSYFLNDFHHEFQDVVSACAGSTVPMIAAMAHSFKNPDDVLIRRRDMVSRNSEEESQ